MADKIAGGTGRFPDGKLGPRDKGELIFAVGEKDGNVTIEFGDYVNWMAMPPQQAVALAEILIAKARVVARRTGVPLIVHI